MTGIDGVDGSDGRNKVRHASAHPCKACSLITLTHFGRLAACGQNFKKLCAARLLCAA